MVIAGRWPGPLVAGGAWLATVLLMLGGAQLADATFPIDFVSGVAVAALLLTATRFWPLLIAMIVAGGLGILLMLGASPMLIAGHLLFNITQPPLTAFLIRRRVRARLLQSMTLKTLLGLFWAVVLGILPALLFVPFMVIANSAVYATQYVLGVLIGTIVITPLALAIRDVVRGRSAHCSVAEGAFYAFLCMASLSISYLAIDADVMPLLFLPFSAIVVAVTRYGQLGASIGLLVFSLAVTLHSAGGHPPMNLLGVSPQTATLYLQLFMLTAAAALLPLAALLNAHDRIARKLATRNEQLRDEMTILDLTENLAGIGVWRYDVKSRKHHFSSQMKHIHGFRTDEEIDEKDLMENIEDGGLAFRTALAENTVSARPWRYELMIRRVDGVERILDVVSINQFDGNRALKRVISVVLDVTQHRLREAALDSERTRAMRLAAEATVLAQTDPLTGLANRRRTMSQLEKSVMRARKKNSTLSLIAFDIDHFKHVNDRFGHQAGDEMLVRVAGIARSQMRDSDLLGRTGGEEFIWILPKASKEIASAAAERLCRAVEKGSPSDLLPGVTVSVGCASLREGDTAESLLSRVDEALYAAKREGRNRTSMAA